MSRTVGPHEKNVAALRRLNAAECITALRDGIATTVSDLSRVTGLSRPTVEAVLGDLVDGGLVAADGSAESSLGGGRPARRYRFVAESGYVAGIAARTDVVDVILADLAGDVVADIARPVPDGVDAVGRIDVIRSVLDEALGAAGLSRHDLRAVGMGVPGIVATDGRILISPQVPGWTGVDVGARVGAGLGCAVELEQEVGLSALAEHRFSDARLFDDLLYVDAAGPVGAAIIIGRVVHRGRHRTAGVTSELDAVASINDVAVEDLADRLGSMAALIDPDVIILGGDLADRDAAQLARLQELIYDDPRLAVATKVMRAQLGSEAVKLGALVRAFDAVSRNLYGADTVPAPLIVTSATPRGRRRSAVGAAAVTSGPAVPVTEAGERRVLGFDADAVELRIGVVGVGARGRLATWAHQRENHAQVVAVADPHPLAVRRARELFGSSVRVVPDHRELIALEPRLHAVFVTSPDDTHADVAVDLLRAGIAVYMEKPLATTVADADRILEAAQASGTKLYVGHNMRHMGFVTTMADVIRRGEIGEVTAIWCRHFIGNGGDFYFKDWHADRRHTNGLLLQKGAHDIDVIHHLAGAYTEDVVGMGDLKIYGGISDRRDNSELLMQDWFSENHWPPSSQTDLNPVVDVEDISMMLMRLTNGVLASYQQCHFTPDYWRNYTVIGTHGRMENFGDRPGGQVRVWNQRTWYNPDGDLSYPIVGDEIDHEDADRATVAEFLHFVRTGEPTRTSPVGARYAVAAGAAATDSLRDHSAPRRVTRLPDDVERYFLDQQNPEGVSPRGQLAERTQR